MNYWYETAIEEINDNIKVDYVCTRDVAIAIVTFHRNGETIVAKGDSKRMRGDKRNSEIAYYLAVGRAFENLSKKLTKRGNGLVTHYENLANSKQAAPAVNPVREKLNKFNKFFIS